MDLGDFGFGVRVSLQGIPVDAKFDLVEVVVNGNGLSVLEGALRFVGLERDKRRESGVPLPRMRGFPCVLQLTYDPKAEEEG